MGTRSTKPIDHSQRAHALLSASGASRWLGCTPSARLEEEYGEDKPSPYAEEGTLAHELAEAIIRRDILMESDSHAFDTELDRITENEKFDPEMLDIVPIYTGYVSDEFAASKASTPDAVLLIEQKVDLTQWIPEAFGSCDAVIIADGVLKVIDLKYGKGVPVSALANKQLMLYGLGAYNRYSIMYDIHTVELHIVQPRIDNISTWSLSVEELLKWAEDEVKPKAKMAFNGEGELQAGDWCKFCKVKARCRALYQKTVEVAKMDFQEPPLLTDDEMAAVLASAPAIQEWLNSVLDYATDEAVTKGKTWSGFKLVEGRSQRKWTDEKEVVQTLIANGYSEDEMYNMKLKGISEIEKLVGKKNFSSVLGGLVVKPQGKPTLVPESDKRPSIGTEDAINDFKE